MNRQTRQIHALKVVPVENDISEVEKEINILRQCESPYIVSYYGSYNKGSELWVSSLICASLSPLSHS